MILSHRSHYQSCFFPRIGTVGTVGQINIMNIKRSIYRYIENGVQKLLILLVIFAVPSVPQSKIGSFTRNLNETERTDRTENGS